MEYNKNLLKSWLDEDEDRLDDCSEEDMSEEELALFHIRDCIETNQKIDYCKKLLTQHKDALIHYTLAVLYRTYDFDPEGNLLYKRHVRYYCIMAIRKNRNYASAWALLSEAYQWVSLVAGEVTMVPSTSSLSDKNSKPLVFKNQKEQIKYIEKALLCVKKALQIDPPNEEYQNMLKYYYQQRNEIYLQGKLHSFGI
jgi:tetratricopeptide (TPR) repeat protein